MQNQPSNSNKTPQESTKEAPIVVPNPKEQQEPRNQNGKAPTNVSDEPQSTKHPSRKEAEPQIADQLEPGEITQHLMGAEAPGSPKETNEELLLLESDPGEETDEGASSSSLHTIPIKNPRGRKSKKKQREEATHLAVLEGSQKTLKGIMHTRSKKGTTQALKEANPFSHSP